MSFNRLGYDTCAYAQDLQQSVGPGERVINVPAINNCNPCLATDPSYGQVMQGGSTVGGGIFKNIDVESDLDGRARLASKCQTRQFMPSCDKPDLTHYDGCPLASEETRTTNPPCNLRGTGWNRWEWLCLDPQAHVAYTNYPNGITPYDSHIDSRLLAKDNYRPCAPKPLDQEAVLPNGRLISEEEGLCMEGKGCQVDNVWKLPLGEPSVQWKQVQNF
ncbi:MAG: hypothetical protein CMB80_14615 [Flammeovirgaceae bacterium]|nr:hypothetical protein [Flammeovirgaceae bacterium]